MSFFGFLAEERQRRFIIIAFKALFGRFEGDCCGQGGKVSGKGV